jgi:integrase
MNPSTAAQTTFSKQNVKVQTPRADLRLVAGRGEFRTWLTELGYSTRTCDLYSQTAGRCATFLRGQGITLGRARYDDIHSFWATVPPTRSSRNGVRNALLAYYKYRGRKDGGPAVDLPVIPEPLTLPRARGDDDHANFVAAAEKLGGEYHALGALLGFTGCRIAEAEHARWHLFNLHSSSPAWLVQGKGSGRRGPKERKVDVCDSLLSALLTWRDLSRSADWVFPSTYSTTGHRGQTSLRRMVAAICESAGIARATPHVWRHTAATLGLDRSMDIRAVQELLGHASLATTQKYTKVLPGRLRRVVELLDSPPDDTIE